MPSAAARNFVDMLPATSGEVRRLGGLQLFLCCSDFLKLWSCDSGMWRGLRLGSGPAEGEGDAGPANDQGRARERRKGLQLHYHG